MKRFTLLLMLLAAGLFAQEAMEEATTEAPQEAAAAEEMAPADTTAMDESMEEMLAPEEETMMEAPAEDTGADIETMLAEEGTAEVEVTSGSALIGYTVGVDLGYPVYKLGGLGASYDQSGPALGISINSPFGFAIGPFEIGLGLQAGIFSFTDSEDASKEISGIVALATFNTSVVETPAGAVSVQVGGGYYGASIGFTGGAAFDYAIPGVPVVLRPYVRGNATLDSGGEASGDEDAAYAWLNAGILISLDLSAIF